MPSAAGKGTMWMWFILIHSDGKEYFIGCVGHAAPANLWPVEAKPVSHAGNKKAENQAEAEACRPKKLHLRCANTVAYCSCAHTMHVLTVLHCANSTAVNTFTLGQKDHAYKKIMLHYK